MMNRCTSGGASGSSTGLAAHTAGRGFTAFRRAGSNSKQFGHAHGTPPMLARGASLWQPDLGIDALLESGWQRDLRIQIRLRPLARTAILAFRPAGSGSRRLPSAPHQLEDRSNDELRPMLQAPGDACAVGRHRWRRARQDSSLTNTRTYGPRPRRCGLLLDPTHSTHSDDANSTQTPDRQAESLARRRAGSKPVHGAQTFRVEIRHLMLALLERFDSDFRGDPRTPPHRRNGACGRYRRELLALPPATISTIARFRGEALRAGLAACLPGFASRHRSAHLLLSAVDRAGACAARGPRLVAFRGDHQAWSSKHDLDMATLGSVESDRGWVGATAIATIGEAAPVAPAGPNSSPALRQFHKSHQTGVGHRPGDCAMRKLRQCIGASSCSGAS